MILRAAVVVFLVMLALPGHAAGAASPAPAGCRGLKPFRSETAVTLTMAPPFYDTKASRAQLNSQSKELREGWLRQNDLQTLWQADDLETAGLAAGGWGVSYAFELGAVPYDRYGTYSCIFFRRLDIDIFYRTKITIPREIAANPCLYGIVNAHELMHHEANRKVVEIYVEKLRRDIAGMILHMEGEYVAHDRADMRVADMKLGVQNVVAFYFQQSMIEKMKQVNAQIDSPDEYKIRSAMMKHCEPKE